MLQESSIVVKPGGRSSLLRRTTLRQRVHAAWLVIIIHPTRTAKPVRHSQPELESAFSHDAWPSASFRSEIPHRQRENQQCFKTERRWRLEFSWHFWSAECS